MVKKLMKISLIGALYTALTFISAPFSFGMIQFRLSEILCLLPLFSPISVLGVTFGCFASNLIGFFIGINPTGILDALIGTFATFSAGVLTYLIGKLFASKKIRIALAPLPPVLLNGLLIGAELTFIFKGSFIINALSVAIGETVICYGLGMVLISILIKNDFYKKIFK